MGGALALLDRGRGGPWRIAAVCRGGDGMAWRSAARAHTLVAGPVAQSGPVRAGWCPFARRGPRVRRPVVNDRLGSACSRRRTAQIVRGAMKYRIYGIFRSTLSCAAQSPDTRPRFEVASVK